MNRRHKKKHHKHHRHHRNGGSEESDAGGGGGSSEQQVEGVGLTTDDMTNIYDCPKVPPIPVDISNAATTAVDNYEALQTPSEEVVYDVPRSNPPRKVEKEAIYVNNIGFEQNSQEYDVPRSVTATAALSSTTPTTQQVRQTFCRTDGFHFSDSVPLLFFSQIDFSRSVQQQ